MMGVYAIKNCETGKLYIGSSLNIERRIKGHFVSLTKGTHFNSHLQYAWNCYGKEAFTSFVLEQVDTKDILRLREQFYIEFYKSADSSYGYNMLSNTNIGLGVSASTEIRQKISNACTGEKNGHYGKKHSESTKAYISKLKKEQGRIRKEEKQKQWIEEKHKCEVCGRQMIEKYGSGRFCSKDCCNRYISYKNKQVIHDSAWNAKVSTTKQRKHIEFSLEHRKKLSDNARQRMKDPTQNPMYGKHHSEETKKHWSETRKGMPSSCGFKGKHHTEETRRKISESLKKRRMQNDL